MSPFSTLRCLMAIVFLCFSTSTNAQVFDSFSDDDFSNNPTWNGDINEFEINPSQQLHLTSANADTSVLYTDNSYINDAEWSFYFHLSFAPSDNNYLRIYLMGDQQNIKNPLNGYFLRYGENGSADGLDLWRQSGTTLTKIIDGTPSLNAASTSQSVNVKVIRSTMGDWILLADYNGGSAYDTLGTITDNNYNTSTSVGFWCKYSSSNATKFYFDDVYVGPIIIDNIAAAVQSVKVLSADTVSVIFSEPVTQNSATDVSHYNIIGVGNPSQIMYTTLNANQVLLVLSSPLMSEENYTLQITGIKDFAANEMDAFSTSILYYEPHPFDIIISEIMPDPSPVQALPDAEYIELYNRKSFPVDLSNWRINQTQQTKL